VVTDPNERDARLDALVDVIVGIYAPVPAATLSWLVHRLRYATPQWTTHLKRALERATRRLAAVQIDGVRWHWPPDERVPRGAADPTVRLLAPFDPVVWDRRRFERLWGWPYRFEAYTPPAKRQFGYYALPLLWGDRVVGWGNLSINDGALNADIGYVRDMSRDPVLLSELDAELERMRVFLGVNGSTRSSSRSQLA
jgi:hypothetical protein